MDFTQARKKWRTHYKHAARRGVRGLTFDEYAQKLLDANIGPENVGRTHGSYQLARYIDHGDYTEKSCRFITQIDNLKERDSNGGTARGSEKMRGRTKEDTPWLAARADAFRGRTAETHDHVAKMANTKGRPFSFVHESGALITGHNLRKYCRDNDLNTMRAGFNKLRKGKVSKYRGWRVASTADGDD